MRRNHTIGTCALVFALTLTATAMQQQAAAETSTVYGRDHAVARHFNGQPFVTHSTPNFRLHSTHAEWAYDAGDLLEYTHNRFYDIWGDLAEPLDQPLTWVGFTHRGDFHRYAHAEDNVDMSWSDGYYSARTNRVVVVHPTLRNTESGPRNRDSDSEVHAQDNSETEHEHEHTPSAVVDTGQITHEAAHQMAFNSGLQRRGVMYPLWVSEGLGTNFETNAEEEFGPDVDNPNRRRQLLRAWNGGRVMNIEDLLVLTRVPRSPGQSISEVYAQCWSFFQFLYIHHQPQLKQYLATLARQDKGQRRNRTLRNEFVHAFGNVQAIEEEFHAFIRTDVARR
ncbi:MAG: DUF1570 domain-containing protein [Phycisphaeraceae bacterium]